MSLFRRLTLEEGWDPARVDRVVTEIDLRQEIPRCWCGEPMIVRKTRRRRLVTLAAGEIRLRVRDYVCKRHESPEVLLPQGALDSLAPRNQRFGWDVLVEVGLQRYVRRRQRVEIQQELWDLHHIRLSTGTISALADRFVQSLGRLHRQKAPDLRAFLENQGGYSLHIDSTNETGRGGLFVAMEGTRSWVLAAGRIETEREDLLRPVLEEVDRLFGPPLAIVRDMSKACKAAARVWSEQSVPDFICHFHFIQSIGRDLLQRPYHRLQHMLRFSGAPSLLRSLDRSARRAARHDPDQQRFAAFVYWLRHGEDRRPSRFPFSLDSRDLRARILALPRLIDLWLPPEIRARNQEPLDSLLELSAHLAENEEMQQVVEDLQERSKLFEELRQILRLEGDELMRPSQPLLPEVDVEMRAHLESELEEFQRRLEDLTTSEYGPHALILRRLRRYRPYLFHHPCVRDEQGTILQLVARTNNDLERLFGGWKQNLRRRTGRCRLTRDLEDFPPDALLSGNLADSHYVRILCGSLDNLPRAFARLGPPDHPLHDVRDHPSRKTLSLIRRLIRDQPELAATSF